MDLIQIYECLCDVTRLRILNLLLRGPLCVCHFQTVLREPQVKISKHLAYLRARGCVTATRQGNWMIYALPVERPRELAANLACLQDCAAEQPVFQRDADRLDRLRPKVTPEAVADVCARSAKKCSLKSCR
jgi:ArsR family transcriptional regulator, arsenate/arsenite/antimonite-responsive transcriptional repressor